MTVLLQCADWIRCEAGYFWHVTDFHYDVTYNNSRLSCNPDNSPATLGRYGDYWCDSPLLLVNSSVVAMANINKAVDFVLWTGDSVLHGKDQDLNYTVNSDILDVTTNILKTTLPGVPVYASFGNHDYYPTDQFPPINNALYNDTLERWRSWINDSTQDANFRKGAYYTVKTAYGLRIVSLNTNLYYTQNKVVQNETDPGDQLAWLESVLRTSVSNSEKVLVTAHIPPGVHTPSGLIWMYDSFHNKLVGILKKYAAVIVGMHFGHDHADEFKILQNNDGVASVPIFIAPSVTPWRYRLSTGETGSAHNPGIRLIKYDRQTKVHLDIEQYYLDLEKANKDGVASWVLEYKATTDYNLTDLSASQLLKLTESMKTSSEKAFTSYWKYYFVSPKLELLRQCDEGCHANIVCGYTQFDITAFKDCTAKRISTGFRLCSSLSVILLIAVAILFL